MSRSETRPPVHRWEYGEFFTIRDVLETPTLRDVRVETLCSPKDLDRPVRWVHIADARRASELLSGGELLLTTGIAWSDDADERRSMIADFARAHVAALLIELGSSWQTVPKDVVQACRDHDLPLLVLYDEIRFVDLTEKVHSMLLESKIAQVTEIHKVTQSFNALIINGAPTSHIVHHAARLLGCPVVLEDLSHRVVTFAEGHLLPSVLLHKWASRSRRWARTLGKHGTLSDCVTVNVAGHTGTKAVVEALAEDVSHRYEANLWTMIDIQAQGIVWGRLFYFGRSPSPAGGDHILQQAATALAMDRLGSPNQHSWVDLLEKTALDRLVNNKYSSAEGVRKVLDAAGFRLANRTIVPVCIQHRHTHVSPAQLREYARAMFHDTDVLLSPSEHPQMLLGAFSLPQHPHSCDHTHLRLQLMAWAKKFPASVHSSVHITYALSQADPHELSAHLRKLAHLPPLHSSSPPLTVEPLSRNPLEHLLLDLREDVRVQQYVSTTLEPLIAYDKKNRGDLLPTLRAVLKHPTSRSAAADELHLSRTALYSRLATIERLLNADLSDGDTNFALNLALRNIPTPQPPPSAVHTETQ
ncbi:MAG: PucR family transcriptional regulator [Corynebacterium sp.]|uniref:PucR family transcriptional regulator n=1 Tax=Corynebacterium sp. TaxID=1720 RepID=UPI0026DB111A|nr:PucR family transcriptional regulator [Corynebacterium sp.]MDO4760818.1 PucR family transcriptional regulator [Corynebacterium sp.]